MITATVKHFLEHLIITQLQENNRENKHTTLQVKKKKERKRKTNIAVSPRSQNLHLFSHRRKINGISSLLFTHWVNGSYVGRVTLPQSHPVFQ